MFDLDGTLTRNKEDADRSTLYGSKGNREKRKTLFVLLCKKL